MQSGLVLTISPIFPDLMKTLFMLPARRLSTKLCVEVYKEGQVYFQSYHIGKPDEPVKVIGTCDSEKHGTKVTFHPDPEIFEETVYDYDTLKQRLRETAAHSQYPKKRHCMLPEFFLLYLSLPFFHLAFLCDGFRSCIFILS